MGKQGKLTRWVNHDQGFVWRLEHPALCPTIQVLRWHAAGRGGWGGGCWFWGWSCSCRHVVNLPGLWGKAGPLCTLKPCHSFVGLPWRFRPPAGGGRNKTAACKQEWEGGRRGRTGQGGGHQKTVSRICNFQGLSTSFTPWGLMSLIFRYVLLVHQPWSIHLL